MIKKLFNMAIVAQCICVALYYIHGNYKPLGSDFMFGVIILSLCIAIFMFWQIFTSKQITKTLKIIGSLFASLPFIWVLGLVTHIFF